MANGIRAALKRDPHTHEKPVQETASGPLTPDGLEGFQDGVNVALGGKLTADMQLKSRKIEYTDGFGLGAVSALKERAVQNNNNSGETEN